MIVNYAYLNRKDALDKLTLEEYKAKSGVNPNHVIKLSADSQLLTSANVAADGSWKDVTGIDAGTMYLTNDGSLYVWKEKEGTPANISWIKTDASNGHWRKIN